MTCERCSRQIRPNSGGGPRRRWCSPSCRVKAYRDRTAEQQTCVMCGTIFNGRRKTCGRKCHGELMRGVAAAKRSRPQTYGSAEQRAKSIIPRSGCALRDDTCSGMTEMTFWHESAPSEWIRVSQSPQRLGRPFWVGPVNGIELAYRWLCRSHHIRTDPAHQAKYSR